MRRFSTTLKQAMRGKISSPNDPSAQFRPVEHFRELARTIERNKAKIAKVSVELDKSDTRLEELYNQMFVYEGNISELESSFKMQVSEEDAVFIRAHVSTLGEDVSGEEVDEHVEQLKGNEKRRFKSAMRIFKDIYEEESFLKHILDDISVEKSYRDKLFDKIRHLEKSNHELLLGALNERISPAPVIDALSTECPVLDQSDPGQSNPTDLSNMKNYYATPVKVRELPISSFVSYCEEKHYIECLKMTHTTHNVDKMMKILQTRILGAEMSILAPFGDIFSIVEQTFKEEKNPDLPKKTVLLLGNTRRIVGNADFGILCRNHDPDAEEEPVIVGKFKGPGYLFDSLAEHFCAEGCQDEACESQRHTRDSIIRQLYNYMVRNGVFVGIYTNYKQTFGLYRDCSGNLLTTEPISENTKGNIEQGQVSVLQFLALSIMIAYDGVVPEFEGSGIDGLLIPCPDGHKGGPCQGHTKLPEACNANNDRKINSHETYNSPPDDSFIGLHLTLDGEPLYFIDLHDREHLVPWSTGQAVRAQIPLKSGEVDTVLKILDTFKQQEKVPELKHEASIYRELASLQGECIPEFVDIGYFREGFLYALGTVYSGENVSSEATFSNEFVDKAVESLVKIHDHGVLHGDLSKNNILRHKETGEPMFIDFALSERADTMSSDDFEKSREAECRELRNILAKSSN